MQFVIKKILGLFLQDNKCLKKFQLVIFIVLYIYLEAGFAETIDNALVGIPELKCFTRYLTFRFETREKFNGRIFLKSMGSRCELKSKQACKTSKTNKSCTMQLYLQGNNKCPALTRKRLLNGIQYTATLVISFHTHFITQVDKMYRLQCMYTNLRNTPTMVKTGFKFNKFAKISKKIPKPIEPSSRIPTCKYQVNK